MKLRRVEEIAWVDLEGGRANAMSVDFLTGLEALAAEVADSDAQAAVVTGYERFFSAGLDLPTLVQLTRPALHAFMEDWQRAMLAWFDLPLPVVAAINGHAIAGGCVLALMCDARIMTETPCKIGLSEAALGIGLPAVVVESLRIAVPASSLATLAIEGRLVDPPTALALGLVEAVAPAAELAARALARARELAQPRAATAQIKRELRKHARAAIAADGALPGWLDTWFSPPAQQRLASAVAKLKR